MKFFRYLSGTWLITGFLILFMYEPLASQPLTEIPSGKIIHLRNINISGNKRTRSSIILRECPFKLGDTLLSANYARLVMSAKENIFNTRLFNFVTIDSSSVKEGTVDINIRVTERWYIWPWPYFEVSDRNFNAWLETTDWSRLTYGIDLTVQNVRGRNETLKFPVHLGFNQQYGFFYQMPYLNRKKTLGINFGAVYQMNHEVVVTSQENKPVYYKDSESYPASRAVVSAGLVLRRGIYVKHSFNFSWSWYKFADTLLVINPEYAVGTNPQFLTFYYQFKNDHRDIQFYPLKGSYFDIELYKYGFWQDVDELHLKTNLRKYWRIHNRWYFASGLTLSANLSKNLQNYFLQKGLGYGRDFVRGYEYYVIDGKSFALLKNNLKFAIIPQRIVEIPFIGTRKFNTIPYALYLNVFTDFGYVYSFNGIKTNQNSMQNTLLAGYGAGLDFTTYYDIVIRMEVSMNGNGEPGVYLHFMAPI
ncbi:MAG: POTRA domain-containing protein [Syntrophothermus sp.]